MCAPTAAARAPAPPFGGLRRAPAKLRKWALGGWSGASLQGSFPGGFELLCGCCCWSVLPCTPKKTLDLEFKVKHKFSIEKNNSSFLFNPSRIKCKTFFHNRNLTSIRIVFCLSKTFFTHLNCDYVQINCFL